MDKRLSFTETSAPLQEVCNVGEDFMFELYRVESSQQVDWINSSKYAKVERMLPTRRACRFHCLWIHL